MRDLDAYYNERKRQRQAAEAQAYAQLIQEIRGLVPQVARQLANRPPAVAQPFQLPAEPEIQWGWRIGQYHTSVDNYDDIYLLADGRIVLAGYCNTDRPEMAKETVDFGRTDLPTELLREILKGLRKAKPGPSHARPRGRRWWQLF